MVYQVNTSLLARGRGSLLKLADREEIKRSRGGMKYPWQAKKLSRVERVIKFLEYLPVTKGPLAGEPMVLLDEQVEFIRTIYGTVKRGGSRRYRIGIQSEPKGNGKTGLVAGICLCHLLGPEAEPRGEVYSAAIDRFQAALIFSEMEAILRQVPELGMLVSVSRFHKKIEVIDGPHAGSTYEALSADARRAHGLSPSLFAYDELAQAKSRELLDNLVNGLGKRKDALGLIISTQAPDDAHPLSQMIDSGLAGTDPSMHVQLLCAPEGADPWDERTWRDCNPALGKFLSLEEMREAALRAKNLPAFEPAFRNLRLNQRVDARTEERIVPIAVWQRGKTRASEASLAGRRCWAALDLSGKQDLTSLTLVFPDDETEPGFDVLPIFWTPHDAIATRRPKERDLFREWVRQGHMVAVPGATIRYGFVADELSRLSAKYQIQVVGYDRWRIEDLKQELPGDFSVPMEPFGQGYKEMGPAIEWFSELAVTGRLRHGGHPVLTAAVAGAITVSDPAGNMKIDKDQSARGPVRVDGAVTLAMALELWRRPIGKKPRGNVDEFLRNAVVA